MNPARPSRRVVLGAVVAAVLTAGLLLTLATAGARERKRPDVVVVVWDTARGDRVSLVASPTSTTPRLAAFARTAVTFRSAFTPSPWTPPAHASLFTGLLPRHHGVREGRGDGVAPDVPLLAETLAAEGYECAGFAANPFLASVRRLASGFDPFVEVHDRALGKGRGEEVVARVEEFLARRAGDPARARRPLFLFVNLMETHLPYSFAPGDVAAVHGPEAEAVARPVADAVMPHDAMAHVLGLDPLPPETVAALGLAYDGALRAADRLTGRLLDAVDGSGGERPRFVAIVGDHGECLGEGGALDHLFSLDEAVLHVPLIIRRPGGLDAGTVEDAQVRLQDVHPTILAAVGIPVPPRCVGDAVALFDGPPAARVAVAEFGPPLAFLPSMRGRFPDAAEESLAPLRFSLVAVRESSPAGTWKHVARTLHPDGAAPFLQREELFDLAADPGGTRDLLRTGGSAARGTAHRLLRLGREGGDRAR